MPTHYADAHSKRIAFLANRLQRLAELITEQGDALLASSGLSIPSRAVSAFLLIAERGRITASDIAVELQQPHQLATQRIDILIHLGLISRAIDPQDARRKTLSLTSSGEQQRRVLEDCLTTAEQVFDTVFKSIDCNLSEVAQHAMTELSTRSMSQRAALVEDHV